MANSQSLGISVVPIPQSTTANDMTQGTSKYAADDESKLPKAYLVEFTLS